MNQIVSPYVYIPMLGHFPMLGELFPTFGTQLICSCNKNNVIGGPL